MGRGGVLRTHQSKLVGTHRKGDAAEPAARSMAGRRNDLPASAVRHGFEARPALPAHGRFGHEPEARTGSARLLQEVRGVARPGGDVGGIAQQRRASGAEWREHRVGRVLAGGGVLLRVRRG
eukprot:14319055-Alexandrium_andersonii.AAC.1